jgi:hypothetical protein
MPSSGGGAGKAAKLPGYIQDVSQNILSSQQKQFGTPYQAYAGQQIADIDPMRQQAWGQIQAMQGQGAPAYQSAIDTTTGLLNQTGTPISVDQLNAQQVGDVTGQFMNPYNRNVLDVAQQRFTDQANTQQGIIGGQASNVGAFGGDRQAVLEGTMRAQAAKNMGDLTANVQQQGYSQAMQNAMGMLQGNQKMQYDVGAFNAGQQQADYNRQLEAARLLPGMAGAQQQYGIQDAQALAAAGAANQGHAQQLFDVAHQQWQDQQAYRQNQIDAYTRTLAGQPMAGGGGGGAQAGGLAGGLKGAAGGALTGAAAGSMVMPGWGTAIGAGIGAVGGGLMGGL